MFRITEDPSSGSLVQCLVKNYKNDSIVSVDMNKVGVMAAYSDPLCVCVVQHIRVPPYTVNYTHTHTHTHAACKRSLNVRGSRNLGKITGHISRPHFHLSLLGSLKSLRTYRHLAAKVGMSKGGGKQWQTTPKNLPMIQCARAIPVT
jgi:hypothetical protein